MNSFPKLHPSLLLTAVLLAGCAAQRVHDAGIAAYDRGEYEDGISKLAQAAHDAPDNLSYRLDLRARQEAAVQKLIAAADDAQANGRVQVAEADFHRVLVLEPGNERAHHGLERLAADRAHGERVARAEVELKGRQIDAADADIRGVLAEDPLFAPALALQSRIEQAKGPMTVVPRLVTHDNRPVTLQFRDAPTKMVFEVLARQTGLNFIFDKDVKSDGKTTIFVSQVPVEEAIDLILAQNQLSRQILSENMVLVYPSTAAKQKDYQDEIVHTFFLANATPKDVESMFKTVLGAKTMYVDERSNALTIRDTPEHVRMAEKLVASMDEPEPEVIMEVEVLEISHTLAQQLGIDYPTSATFTPNPVQSVVGTAAATGSGLVLADLGKQNSHTISVSSLAVSVDLLKTVGDTNVLSSPRIRARNKEKAKILVGNRVPVITSGTSATVGGSYSTSSVQYLDVGLTLDVQPTIHTDGNVAIKVGLEVSSIANTLNVPIGNGGTTIAYEISTRNANTLLELRDGETQVLAGLIQDSDSLSSSHIPGLGDMPIIGKLFGSDNKQRNKSEIVLAITPRIIRAQSRPPSETTEFYYGTESQSRSAPFAMVSAPAGPTSASPAANPAQPMSGGVSTMSGASSAPAMPTGPHPAPMLIESTAAQPLPAQAAAVQVPAEGASGAPPAPTTGVAAETAGGIAAAAGGTAAPAGGAPEPPPPDAKPKVTLEGPDSARVGDEVSVSVKLASGQSLGRVRAQVRYDASALQLTSADPGDLVPAGDSPKLDTRPGGVQLEFAGTADAPVRGNGSIVDLHFHVLAARPAASLDTQVVLLGEDGTVVAATAATPLKMALSPP